jgi:hypothetical protein
MSKDKIRFIVVLEFPCLHYLIDGVYARNMESSLKQLLDKAVLDKMEWETVTLPFPSSDGNNVNLCDYIGLDCSRSGECFFFPEEYNSCSKETRDSLAKTL